MASENVTDSAALVATPVALFAGDVAVTVGAVVSGVSVVNEKVLVPASAMPARSCPATVMVYIWFGSIMVLGANVTTVPPTLQTSAARATVGDSVTVTEVW